MYYRENIRRTLKSVTGDCLGLNFVNCQKYFFFDNSSLIININFQMKIIVRQSLLFVYILNAKCSFKRISILNNAYALNFKCTHYLD